MNGAWFDIAHMLAGGLVLLSLMLLYQDRMFALLNVFALHAVLLSASVAWQAQIQGAPHLYITALIALALKAVVIPVALRRIVVRLGIHRTIETVVGIGPTMLAGMPLVVEISIAFSVLIAFIVIGVFLFRIRERFDSVDVSALDAFRGERR